MSSIICDGTDIDEIINEFNTPVIVRQVTKTFTGEYGDATESYNDYNVNVFIQTWSAETREVNEGVFHPGSVTITFKNKDNYLAVEGNRVKYNNDWYEIARVVKQPCAGTLYYVYALLKQI